jgi:hypothetical protein
MQRDPGEIQEGSEEIEEGRRYRDIRERNKDSRGRYY